MKESNYFVATAVYIIAFTVDSTGNGIRDSVQDKEPKKTVQLYFDCDSLIFVAVL